MVARIIFSSNLEIWYVEVRISRSVSESPFEFEITRVDCSNIYLNCPESYHEIHFVSLNYYWLLGDLELSQNILGFWPFIWVAFCSDSVDNNRLFRLMVPWSVCTLYECGNLHAESMMPVFFSPFNKHPSRHTTLKQCRFNVESTLFQRCVLAGILISAERL